MPSSVAFDDQVRIHLSYLRHCLIKQVLLPQDFEVTPISTLSLRRAKAGNEERSSYVPKVATAKGRFEAPIGLNSHKNDGKTVGKNSAEKQPKKSHIENADFDPTNVIQIRSDTSSSGLNGQNLLNVNRLKKQKRKMADRTLRKLRDGCGIEGFLSCTESQNSTIEKLKCPDSDPKRGIEESKSEQGLLSQKVKDSQSSLRRISASQARKQQEELEEID